MDNVKMDAEAIIGLPTAQICPTIRSILLRCTENNDALNVRLEKLKAAAHTKKENKNRQLAVDMVHELYSRAVSKGQLCMYAGNLLLYTVEGLNQLESIIAKKRANHRKASRLNRDLKRSTVLIIDRLAELQNIFHATKESAAHWRFMYELSEMEFRLTEAVNETEIWTDSRPYDMRWDASAAGPLARASQPIIEAIQEGLIKEAIVMVRDLEKPSPDHIATYATCLEGIAQVCYEYGFYKHVEDILRTVLEIRSIVYGPKDRIINATLNCLGLVYAKLNNIGDMNNACTEALAILETEAKKSGEVITLSRQYMRTGSMWFYYTKLEEGLALMRLGVTWLASGLPANLGMWTNASVQLARAKNAAGQHDEAVSFASKVIDRMHESVHGLTTGPKIHEIAYSLQQEFDRSKDKHAERDAALSAKAAAALSEQIPPPTQLPSVYEQALKEVAVGYAGLLEFRAANVMKDYLDSCEPFSSSEWTDRPKRKVKFFPKAKDPDTMQ